MLNESGEEISQKKEFFFIIMFKILYLVFVDLNIQPCQDVLSNCGCSWLTSEDLNTSQGFKFPLHNLPD